MNEALIILKKYWHHNDFRSLQPEIIDSVLKKQDTLAIMPTGGGKSICFQVPVLMKEGIGLVISPLIALMKDQVENLQKRNIKALALTGGISINETVELLDNCLFGNYKFLYLSPERLQSEWILEYIKNLPINLIAIDEAHCVSQWGHDFRPAYLKISEIKKHFPKIPFLALTATATPRVKEDIVKQLQLKNPKIFQKSFARENIAYMTFETEDKFYKIQQILKKQPQPAIIYVRNRKSCLSTCNQLKNFGIEATFYHGGLSFKEKEKNRMLWMEEKAQVIVATNAFGMGIDKPNVGTVIHTQLPENLENYYQEAGRAGRNGEKSFAVLLFHTTDINFTKKQFLESLPDKKFLTQVYNKLFNYFQIAYGEGINEKVVFDLNRFCTKYDFPVLKTYNAIQFLDRQGIISVSQEFSKKISLQFIIPSKEVIRYISLNPNQEEIILTIIRTYPGIYEMELPVNLALIAKKAHQKEENLIAILEKLKEKKIISYQAQNNDISLVFNEVREDEKTINRVSKHLETQNKLKKSQLEAVISYVKNSKNCKSQLLLDYFGETTSKTCGICSYCIKQKNKSANEKDLNNEIFLLLKKNNLSSREIINEIKFSEKEIILALQNLLENNKIKILANNKYSLHENDSSL